MSSGEILLDKSDTPTKSTIHESCIVIEDVMAETPSPAATD